MQDRFESPKPIFQSTSNQSAIEAITPKETDHTPAPTVVERLHQAGHSHLAELLQEAQQQAKLHALTQTHIRKHVPVPRVKKENDSQVRLPVDESEGKYQLSDVVSDREFIRRTRDGNLHTPEMQSLFWANGGQRHLVGGLSYAQAFSNLRREKMTKLQGEKVSSTPYQRHTSVAPGTKSITPGTPSQQDRQRKILAAMVQEEKP